MNNKENRAWAKFANGVVPFLILIVKNVPNRHSVWVIEDQGGGCEINAVSREVVFVLLLVVFESHPGTQDTRYHGVHTYVNTVFQSNRDRGRSPVLPSVEDPKLWAAFDDARVKLFAASQTGKPASRYGVGR